MKTLRTFPLSLLVALAAGLVSATVHAQEPDAKKPVTYAVVQVDEDLQVVKTDEVDALKDRLKQEHKQALQDHKQAVKDAKANKEKPPAKPKAKKLKVIKASLQEAAARQLVEELKEKAAKKGQKKPPKKSGSTRKGGSGSRSGGGSKSSSARKGKRGASGR